MLPLRRVDSITAAAAPTKNTAMQRFCRTHTARGSSRAWRLLAARHSLDRHAEQLVVDEIGDCAQCWQDTALAAIDAADSLLIRCGPLPEMDSAGNTSGPVMDELFERIGASLSAEELDRRELGE